MFYENVFVTRNFIFNKVNLYGDIEFEQLTIDSDFDFLFF